MNQVDYKIIRSKRKTISISLTSHQGVLIRAPFFVKDQEIERIVNSKRDWIKKHLDELVQQQREIKQRKFISGEKLFYLGQEYQLKVVVQDKLKKPMVSLNRPELVVTVKQSDPAAVRAVLAKWYQQMAKELITQKISGLCKQYQEEIGTIRIKELKSRWGSCSSKRNLNFNWKLMMAPESVLDYVVVHEFCHLKQMNHSNDFWSWVEQIMPGYQQPKLWLKKYGHYLTL